MPQNAANPPGVDYRVRGPVSDHELSDVHARAFGVHVAAVVPWNDRLKRWSLTWVTAEREGRLVGFVNVVGDGGAHAVLLDTAVDPTVQGRGIGRALVAAAEAEARQLGCAWLHVDYEPDLADFYERVCGFRVSPANLKRLR